MRPNEGEKTSSISSPVSIVRPPAQEMGELSRLFTTIVESLPYYNDVAKRSEVAKYSVDLLRNSISADPDSVLAAKLGPTLAGFCFSQRDDGLIWLAWFGVVPPFRRQGIGMALLATLEERAVRAGSHKIWCDCRTTNVASRSILAHAGYVELCTATNHWYGQDFVLWERFIG
jgi:GNAT superfamily N-acetyltransferase